MHTVRSTGLCINSFFIAAVIGPTLVLHGVLYTVCSVRYEEVGEVRLI